MNTNIQGDFQIWISVPLMDAFSHDSAEYNSVYRKISQKEDEWRQIFRTWKIETLNVSFF